LLESQGWTVCRFWEHEIWESLDTVAQMIRGAIAGSLDVPSLPRWHVAKVIALDPDGRRERRMLQSLRDPEVSRNVEQWRHTTKWKMPSE
jgi:DNA mismatch endonuclease, patch repair protein